MPRAIWNNQIIAEAPATEIQRVEGNIYFPFSAVKQEFLRPSDTHSICVWKGVASYYDVAVDGEVNKDAAWYYPRTSPLAQRIKGYVAFWRGVRISITDSNNAATHLPGRRAEHFLECAREGGFGFIADLIGCFG